MSDPADGALHGTTGLKPGPGLHAQVKLIPSLVISSQYKFPLNKLRILYSGDLISVTHYYLIYFYSHIYILNVIYSQ